MRLKFILCLTAFSLLVIGFLSLVSANYQEFHHEETLSNLQIVSNKYDSGFYIITVKADTLMRGCGYKLVNFYLGDGDSNTEKIDSGDLKYEQAKCNRADNYRCVNSSYNDNSNKVAVNSEFRAGASASDTGNYIWQNISFYYTFIFDKPGTYQIKANARWHEQDCSGTDWGGDTHSDYVTTVSAPTPQTPVSNCDAEMASYWKFDGDSVEIYDSKSLNTGNVYNNLWDLRSLYIDNDISSLSIFRTSCFATLYRDYNFQGTIYQTFSDFNTGSPDLSQTHIGDNTASSIKIAGLGCEVSLGLGKNYANYYNIETGKKVAGEWGNGLYAYVNFAENKAPVFEIPASSELNLQKFTVEGWVKLENKWANYNEVIIQKQNSATNRNFLVYSEANTGNLVASSSINAVTSSINSNVNIRDNQWHYFVYTYDGNNQKIYVDAILKKTQAIIGNADTPNVSTYIASANLGVWYIFQGATDEIAIWNKALSDTEVQEHYNNMNSGKDYCGQSILPDTTPPEIKIISPADGEQYSSTDANFALTYSADDSVSCWYKLDNGAAVNLLDCLGIQIDMPAVGTHTITVYGNDSNGNVGSDTHSFSVAVPEIDAYFTDMTGTKINETDLNDMVKATTSSEAGQDLKYELWRDDLILDNLIKTETSSLGHIIWKANETGDFYFKVFSGSAELVDSRSNLDYGVLTVREENNTPPTAVITSPKDKQVYFLSEQLNFSQASYDEDDNFDYTWYLGDGRIIRGDSITKANYSFIYAYTTTGQKNIVLEVADARGLVARDKISVLIINSSYVLSYISKPKWGEWYGRAVAFDATESYAINSTISNNVRSITCLAGNCPAKTEGCPPESSSCSPYPECCQIAIENTPNWNGFGNLEFNWTFDNITDFSAMGFGGSNFTRIFPIAGKHYAKLITSINPSSETDTEFNVMSEGSYCYEEEGAFYWLEGNSIINAFNDCHREVAAEGSSNNCCPYNYDCTQQEGSWACEFSGVGLCSDYKSQAECEDFSSGVAIYDNEQKSDYGAGFCTDPYSYHDSSKNCDYYVSSCRCDWNGSSCMSAYDFRSACGTEDITQASCYQPDRMTTNCTAGFRFISWDWFYNNSAGKVMNCTSDDDCANAVSLETLTCNAESGLCESENCNAGNTKIPCLSEALLSFFTTASLIVALLIIIIFYLVVARKKKKFAERKRKR